MKHIDVIRASIDPLGEPNRPPGQSVSEEQQNTSVPVHGLRLWNNVIRLVCCHSSMPCAWALNYDLQRYFSRKNAVKAANESKRVGIGVKDAVSAASEDMEQRPSAWRSVA